MITTTNNSGGVQATISPYSRTVGYP